MSERITIDKGFFAEQLDSAAKSERERIIKQLEDYQAKALASHIVYLGLERAIKIIKGEYK
jgi:hypothetical protein